MRLRKACTCILIALLTSALPAVAAEYSVEMDCWSDDTASPCAHGYSYSPSLVDDEFMKERDWWSAYLDDIAPDGSRLENDSKRTVVGIHIKVLDPQNDSFKVDLKTAARFCLEVWQNAAATEVVFNKSNVPPGGVLLDARKAHHVSGQ